VAGGPRGPGGRTGWFAGSHPRPPGAGGGESAPGRYMGLGARDEYAAGIAYTGRLGSSRTPDALLCRALR
ncbi:glycoside hydrolase, partial [Streptomyces wuyuanensis]